MGNYLFSSRNSSPDENPPSHTDVPTEAITSDETETTAQPATDNTPSATLQPSSIEVGDEALGKFAQYEVFISHAGEDKATIAIPLREKLKAYGITAFVDMLDMKKGTESQDAMISAMETAQLGVIVLSPEFVARKWPMKEFICFLRRHKEAKAEKRNGPVIIPFFYRLRISELYDEPRLDRLDKDGELLYHKSRFYERMKAGEPEANIGGIKAALRKAHDLMGVENVVDASNDSSYLMSQRREFLLERLCKDVREAVSKEVVNAETKVTERAGESNEFRAFYDSAENTSKLVHKFHDNERLYANTPEGEILKRVAESSSNEERVLAVHGIAGVGKTSVLRGLLGLERLKQRFKDGIYLISLGMDSTERTLIEALSTKVESSGGRRIADEMRTEIGCGKIIEKFRSWFANKQCLFLVDDVWKTEEMCESTIEEILRLHESGRDSKVLLTTRDMNIASRSDVPFLLEPREALDCIAREILVRYAVVEPEKDSTDDKNVIDEILEKCCGLPLFLAIAGKAVRTLSLRKGRSGSAAYHEYAKSLSAQFQRYPNTDVGSYRRLSCTLSLSMELLEKRKKDLGIEVHLSVEEMHRRLCVLEKQEKVPMSMLRHLWDLKDDTEAAIVAWEFEQIGLAETEIKEDESCNKELLRLHDSLHLFASTEAKRHGEEKTGIEALLRGYGEKVETEEGYRKWWCVELESDGYIHEHVCRHLVTVGEGREVVSLLMTPLWTARQLKVNGIQILERDFSFGIRAVQERASYGTGEEEFEVEKTLELICEAAKLSWTFVAENHRELWFQIYGRLIGLTGLFKGIEVYMNKVRREAEGPWLESRNCILMPPGGMNVRIISLNEIICCMVLLGDGERAGCGCRDGRIFIVNMKRGEIEEEWKAHGRRVQDITIGREGTRLVSCSDDRTAKVWDLESRRCVTTFKGHTDWVNCVAVMKDEVRVVSGSRDGTAQVWDMETGHVMSEPFRNHNSVVRCVAVMGDEDYVITGGGDCLLWLWSASSGVSVGRSFSGHTELVTSVAVSMDQCRIVSGSLDGGVRLWDIGSRTQIGEPFKGYDRGRSYLDIFGNIAVSRDGRRIAYGSNDNSIRVWDVETRKEVCTPLLGHTDNVIDILFLTDVDAMVSCSLDQSVRVWDIRREKLEGVGNRHGNLVTSVSFTPNGKFWVSGSNDFTLRIWDTNSGRQVGNPLLRHEGCVTGVAVTADGRRIVSSSIDKTVRVWDLESQELLHTLTGHTDLIECVAITPNGNRAVTGSYDGTVRVWDLNTLDGSHIVLEGHITVVRRVFVSDDGKRAICVDHQNNIFVWELETGQTIKQRWVRSAKRLSRRDIMNLVGEPEKYDNVVSRIWFRGPRITYSEGQGELILATMESYIRCLAVSPDKKTVCVGLGDGQVGFMTLER